MPLIPQCEPLDLHIAVSRLREWTRCEQHAMLAGDRAQAAKARRFVFEYTLLVVSLQKHRSLLH